MPVSWASFSVAAGGRSMTTPRASRTSAAPHAEDAARLPCFATRAPAAAATIAPIVEMLTVRARSPPVPTRSVSLPGMLTGVASLSIADARPSTSAGVSPFIRSPIPNAAIWAGVAAPSMISLMAQAAASAVSESPLISWPSRLGHECSASMAFLRYPVWCSSAARSGLGRGGTRAGSRALPHQASERFGQRRRVDRMADHSVGARPRRQPAIVSPANDEQHGRAVIYLVLGLAADTHSAGRLGFAVEHHDVRTAGVEQPDQRGMRGHVNHLGLRHVRRGATADRQP